MSRGVRLGLALALALRAAPLAFAQAPPAAEPALAACRAELAEARAELVVVRSSRDQFERLVASQMARGQPPSPAPEAPSGGAAASGVVEPPKPDKKR